MSTAVVIVLALLAARIPFSSDVLRKRVIEGLAARLDAQVELGDLTLRFSPELNATGTGLRIRHKGRTDVPPLLSVDRFIVSASLTGLWRRQVRHVKLEGLEIQIPPGDEPDSAASGQPRVATQRRVDPVSGREATADETDFVKEVQIQQLDAPDARLTILRRDPRKMPRVWSMHTLTLRSVGLTSPMPFHSVLTNAVPPGTITTTGTFGPWQREDPGRTPLNGQFTFADADLSVFEGIAGTLSAKGRFGGSLDFIDIDGETTTPDFTIVMSGHAVPLTATYHAIVDGTNGNTTLDPVNATFLQTSLVAKGGVFEAEGVKGRVVRLHITMEDGRLEDIMQLAVNTPRPPMIGRLQLTTGFELPPGQVDVVRKLKLNGHFAIDSGRFTDAGVQTKINELSRRASGRKQPDAADARPGKVSSNFSGRFALDRGRLSLPVVTFDVPGAVVELAGAYGLEQEVIDFSGSLFMDAKLSETTTGFKSLLLKIVDPLFRRDGRTVVPLKINGRRSDPQFGLDVRRALTRGSARPKPASSNERPPMPPPTRSKAARPPTAR